jgi:hypothetical protein
MPYSRRCVRARVGTVVADRGPRDGLAQDAGRLERVHRQGSVEMRRQRHRREPPARLDCTMVRIRRHPRGVRELTAQATTIAWSTRAAALHVSGK